MVTQSYADDTIRNEFVTGLINAHAVEKQARTLIEAQLGRLQRYPEVASRLRRHLEETNMQEERLDKLLARFNENRSIVKDTVLTMGASMNAMFNSAADDAILKNTFSSAAFESYEAAAYESLIAMAHAGGFQEAISPLRQSLEEERAMAEWFQDNIGRVTEKYLQLKAAGESADR